MEIDLSTLERGEIYAALIQSIIPRPVAWVLSENVGGNYNLAPFSYFNAVASAPPLIMLSIGKKPDKSEKDTRRNIRERSAFVIHIPHREQAEAVTDSSVVLGHGESEVERQGHELVGFDGCPLPRLAACRIALYCERYQILDIGPVPQALILGEVKRIHIDETILVERDGKRRVDAKRLDPIARLGGDDYATLGDILTVPRPPH